MNLTDHYRRKYPGVNTDKRDNEYARHCFERDHAGRYWSSLGPDAQQRHITAYRRDFR